MSSGCDTRSVFSEGGVGGEIALLHFNHQMVSSITMQRQMRGEWREEVLLMVPALSIFINTSSENTNRDKLRGRLVTPGFPVTWPGLQEYLKFTALFVVGGLLGFGCA